MNSKSLTIAAIVAASALMATAFTVATPQQAFAGGGDSETNFKIKQKQGVTTSGAFNLGLGLQCATNVDVGVGTIC